MALHPGKRWKVTVPSDGHEPDGRAPECRGRNTCFCRLKWVLFASRSEPTEELQSRTTVVGRSLHVWGGPDHHILRSDDHFWSGCPPKRLVQPIHVAWKSPCIIVAVGSSPACSDGLAGMEVVQYRTVSTHIPTEIRYNDASEAGIVKDPLWLAKGVPIGIYGTIPPPGIIVPRLPAERGTVRLFRGIEVVRAVQYSS